MSNNNTAEIIDMKRRVTDKTQPGNREKKVMILKTVQGEELIGMTEGYDSNGNAEMYNPFRVMLMPSRENQNQVEPAFVQYLPYVVQDSFVFPCDHIMHLLDPVHELKVEYNRLVNPSNIMVPQNKGLVDVHGKDL